jgi:predicted Rossmann-fold nucleotide-binding protein
MQHLPFQPIRQTLYSPGELLEGFDPADPQSLRNTRDLLIYQFFVTEGRGQPASHFTSMMESMHDNSINQAREETLVAWDRIIGVMGDHLLNRDLPAYQQVAALARSLAAEGALLATGGGPGAMEAAHLGAALAKCSDKTFEEVLAELGREPMLPPALKMLVLPSGEFDPPSMQSLHRWWLPAIQLARRLGSEIQPSLAIPTWHYGHETFTPFATLIGKYFQNSLRENGLVAVCNGGVIFTQGKAGTVEEVFLNVSKNYYRGDKTLFSPMVFLGSRYWTETYPVLPLLKALFEADDFRKYILVSDSIEQVKRFLLSFAVR